MVERQLPKLNVVGSIPIARSKASPFPETRPGAARRALRGPGPPGQPSPGTANCGRAIISQKMPITAAKAGKPKANQAQNRR